MGVAFPHDDHFQNERRGKRRADLMVQVECRLGNAYCIGRCETISESGIQVRSRQTFARQDPVIIRFCLPPRPTAIVIETSGVVVWAEVGVSMGIKFVDLKERYRETIAQFVEQAIGTRERGH